uniref:Uncharacterized protein n=1 Tax=Rhizophagus irregularis (strain DAOM 181602 / DAOM 197198 / MUCL 43194) TaxID=747089 RepID=U9SPC4_RHIID
MEETNKELSMRPQYGIVEEESKGRVDYAIKEAEDLIYITGDKQHKIPKALVNDSKEYANLRKSVRKVLGIRKERWINSWMKHKESVGDETRLRRRNFYVSQLKSSPERHFGLFTTDNNFNDDISASQD